MSRVSEDPARLERLVNGDKAAWDDFVGRYASVIYAAVRRRLGAAGRMDDVDDVAQEVFVRLCSRGFKLLRGYDPSRAALTTWLTVIATSTAIDHLRRRRAATTSLDDAPESALAVNSEPVHPVKLPPDLLSPRQTLVIEMLYRRDMEVADVAAALEVDPQTVRSMHHKALTKLRAHFKDDGG